MAIGFTMSPYPLQRRNSSPFSLYQNGMAAPAVRPMDPEYSHGYGGSRDFPALSQSTGDFNGGSYSAASAPLLPPGFQAPAPEYIRGIGQAQTANELGNRRIMDNYERNQSMQRGQDAQAGAFAAAKSQGQNDFDARRSAYLYGHNQAPLIPGPYGQLTTEAPTVYVPPMSGRGASPGAAPMMFPPGTNVVAPPMGGAGMKPMNPVDRSTAYKNYLSPHTVQEDVYVDDPNNPGKKTLVRRPRVEYSMAPKDAEKGANEDMNRAGGYGVTGGQIGPPNQPQAAPVQPQYPTSNQQGQSPYPPSMADKRAAAAGGQIQITEQHARAMLGAMRVANPNLNDTQLAQMLRQHLHEDYGVSPEAFNRTFENEMGGDIRTNYNQIQIDPATRTPISMLGPSNGMDPATRSGAARQARPGPTVPGAPSGRIVQASQPGYTPIGTSPPPAAQPTTQRTTFSPQVAQQQAAAATQAAPRQVVLRGTSASGRPVVKYDDGSIEYEQ